MHLINRTEALQHGLPVVTPTEPVEALMLDYYRELCTDMLLLEPFNAAAMLRAASVPGAPLPTVPVRLERAYIETTHTCDAFVSEGQIEHRAIPGPPGAPVQQGIAYEVFTEEWHAVS